MTPLVPPRSVLHALAPQGLGSEEVESLTSYFCRLAHSHGATATHLAVWVLARKGTDVKANFKWFRRSFAGLDERAEQWAAWLAELTGMGELDRLTLRPWRYLVANASLAPHGDRWCPQCLAEDRAAGHEPYLRLVWDVGPVTACVRHHTELVSVCPHCGHGRARHRASAVVPGYCTACGGFLGAAVPRPTTPQALWIARQVGQALAQPPAVTKTGELLKQVVARMAKGNVAAFAKRLGLSKSGVWHWFNRNGLPTLDAWLKISLQGGIGLDRLFGCELEGWAPAPQLLLPLPDSPRKGIVGVTHDWDVIRKELEALLKSPRPVSLREACDMVGADHKSLYLRAPNQARAIAERYRCYRQARQAESEERLRGKIEALLEQRLEEGYMGLSARELRQHIADSEIASVRHSFKLIQSVRQQREN